MSHCLFVFWFERNPQIIVQQMTVNSAGRRISQETKGINAIIVE